MLGRARPAIFFYYGEHDFIDVTPAREKFGLVGADWLRHVVVDIAVAKMTERHRSAARNKGDDGRVRLLDEGRDRGDWDGDVLLDRTAGEPLHFAEQFADAPECLALLDTVGDGGV